MKTWLSDYSKCDICGGPIKGKVEYFVDGQTKMGPWALMCPTCFKRHGVAIKVGYGQKYDGKTGKLIAGGSSLK